MIDDDFRTLLVSLLPDDTVVEKGKISQEQASTRVYFERSLGNQELDIDGGAGLKETIFDVEVQALIDDDRTTQTLTETLKATFDDDGLHGWRGTSGDSVILGIFISDHSDQYEPKLLSEDEGYDVATFQALVVHQ